jgi:hypothetical protein
MPSPISVVTDHSGSCTIDGVATAAYEMQLMHRLGLGRRMSSVASTAGTVGEQTFGALPMGTVDDKKLVDSVTSPSCARYSGGRKPVDSWCRTRYSARAPTPADPSTLRNSCFCGQTSDLVGL